MVFIQGRLCARRKTRAKGDDHMADRLGELKYRIDSLTVFSDIKNDPVIRRLRALLDAAATGDADEIVKCRSAFLASMYPVTSDLTEYIETLLLQDDNFYVKNRAAGIAMRDEVISAAENELDSLMAIASFTPDMLPGMPDNDIPLPSWSTHEADLKSGFHEKMANISIVGYGMFAKYNFFRLEDGNIVPVAHPDFQRMDQLFGYERERSLIVKNTLALINGTGANNMLLYGDAGTGKSSTIKAVAAYLAPKGLRIIEVKKSQLYQIPQIMEELSSNPLKFILFIDDLSFTGNDDNFSALKATLEGSISGCGDNVAIYATSNRRHLVKETMDDRTGDELHVNDTLQETMSLSARFGLTITFQKPDKDQYLEIVRSLAAEYGIDMDEDELFRKAEAHALRANGRSPRTAKQFVELLKIGI